MKCPYRNFQDCMVEKCPACNYATIKETVIAGHYPHYMSVDRAIKQGCAWEETKTKYRFISCKLADNCVQPVPSNKQIINNTTQTNVSVKRSIF